jgi:DNA-binding GntR family transcriptional regulator
VKLDVSPSIVGQAAPLHVQVYDHIWQVLMTGELPAGARLKDGTWAERLGVSRTPVREAFRKLMQDGAIDPLDSVGFCVHSFTAEEVIGLYRCRAALEGLVAEEAAVRRDAELLSQLAVNIGAADAALQQSDVEALQRLNGEFHALLLKVCRNRHLSRLVEQTERSVRMARQQVMQRASSDTVRREDYLRSLRAVLDHHRVLAEAIAAGDVARAAATMREHLLGTARDMTSMLAVEVACAA